MGICINVRELTKSGSFKDTLIHGQWFRQHNKVLYITLQWISYLNEIHDNWCSTNMLKPQLLLHNTHKKKTLKKKLPFHKYYSRYYGKPIFTPERFWFKSIWRELNSDVSEFNVTVIKTRLFHWKLRTVNISITNPSFRCFQILINLQIWLTHSF